MFRNIILVVAFLFITIDLNNILFVSGLKYPKIYTDDGGSNEEGQNGSSGISKEALPPEEASAASPLASVSTTPSSAKIFRRYSPVTKPPTSSTTPTFEDDVEKPAKHAQSLQKRNRAEFGAQPYHDRGLLEECKNLHKFAEILSKAEPTPRYADAWKLGHRYFYTKTEVAGVAPKWLLQEPPEEDDEEIKEPRKLMVEDPFISPDGQFYAIFNAKQKEIQIYDLREDREDLMERIKILQDSLHHAEFDWLHDSSGFFYVFKKTTENESGEDVEAHYLKFHKIGVSSSKKDPILIKPTDDNFCIADSPCAIDSIVSTNDGAYLFIVSYSRSEGKVIYFYNLIHIDRSSLKSSKLVPLKHYVNVDTYMQQLYILGHTDGKIYLINEMVKPSRISEVELISRGKDGIEMSWKTVLEFGTEDEVENALGVDVDKMLLSMKYTESFYNDSDISLSSESGMMSSPFFDPDKLSVVTRTVVELRYLTNGTLIRQFPLKCKQSLWFSGRLGDPEVLFISSLMDQLTEIYAYNASDALSDPTPLITQKLREDMEGLIAPFYKDHDSMGLKKFKYPEPFRDEENFSVYNNIKLQFPYKWMERKENLTNLGDYIKEQQELTHLYLSDCENREKFSGILEVTGKMEKYSNAWKLGKRYLYTKENATDSSSTWYILGINNYDTDNEPRRLTVDGIISNDATLLAKFDENRKEIQIRYITGNQEILVETVALGVHDEAMELDWLGGSSGVFYILKRKNRTGEEHSIYYHKIGWKADQLVLKPDRNFCIVGAECVITDIASTPTTDGTMLFVASYSRLDEDQVVYFYNMVNLNLENLEHSKIVPLKHNILRDSDEQQLYIFAQKDGKLYFINELEEREKVSEVEIAPNGGIIWRTVLELSERDAFHSVVGFDHNKMLLTTWFDGNPANSSVELRYLQNGLLIRKFPLKYQERLEVTGNLEESEALFVYSVMGQLTEIYSFDASEDPQSELKPFRPQGLKTDVDVIQYKSSIQGYNMLSVSLLRKKDFVESVNSSVFIFLQAESSLTSENLALIAHFDAVIALHERINHPPPRPLQHKQFFTSIVEMNNNVQNVIDIGDAIIKNRYTTNKRLFLVGLEENAALAANVVNRRPDLFGAVLISGIQPNFNPMEQLPVLCPDSYSFYGEYEFCVDINSVLFPRISRISPLLHAAEKFNDTLVHPTVILNIHQDLQIPKNFREYPTDLVGLQYLAELQHKIGVDKDLDDFTLSIEEEDKVKEKKNPVLLLVNNELQLGEGEDESNYSSNEENRKILDWPDFLCILEKAAGFNMTTNWTTIEFQ